MIAHAQKEAFGARFLGTLRNHSEAIIFYPLIPFSFTNIGIRDHNPFFLTGASAHLSISVVASVLKRVSGQRSEFKLEAAWIVPGTAVTQLPVLKISERYKSLFIHQNKEQFNKFSLISWGWRE